MPDRALTLLFATPDMPSRLVCFGAFPPTADPMTMDAPSWFMPTTGALGTYDPSAPGDLTKTTGLPYGAVVPVPLSESAVAALKVFKVVVYLLDSNPASIGSDCGKQWRQVKGDPKRWTTLGPGTLAKGEHALLSTIGCLGAPDATGGCGISGNDFEFRVDKLSQTKPVTGNIGLQFLHLSQFPGGGPAPSWQNVDIYLWPQAKGSAGDAGVGPSPFMKIAENVKYKDFTGLRGLTLPTDVSGEDSYLVIAPRVVAGTTSLPCSSPEGYPTSACPNYTIPLRPFLGATASSGGGVSLATNQVVALVGSPAADSTGARSVRMPFIRAMQW